MSEQKSLAQALPEEQARVRELLADYKALGPVGQFGAIMIERDLAAADVAVMSGDIAAMIRAYETLKGCQ